MQKADVMRRFALMSDTACPEQYADLVDHAVQTVSALCREGVDPDEERLITLAAAEANLLYRRMIAARRADIPGYAGTVRGRETDFSCRSAERLRNAFRENAADLLRDDAFVFRRAGDGIAER